ncbi:MAG: SDR family oxidoreductase [Kofleriaceae bacterium]
MKLANATVLITGANRGLGRALVTASLARGARRVYAGSRDLAKLVDLPAHVVPVQLDVNDPRSLAAVVANATDVNLLINNAGVLVSGGALTSSPEQIAQEFATNVFGTLAATRAFTPTLVRAKGAVLNVLSVVSFANMPGLGIYSAAKAASYSLTQALRADLAKQDVRVHAAFPGAIDTDMVRAMEMPKTSAADVASGILDGLEDGLDEIIPDPMARDLHAMWKRDPRELERALASMG